MKDVCHFNDDQSSVNPGLSGFFQRSPLELASDASSADIFSFLPSFPLPSCLLPISVYSP